MCVSSIAASRRSRSSRAREAVDAGEEVEVLAHGQVLVERELLAHVADAAGGSPRLRCATSRPSTRGRALPSARAGRTGCGSASTCPSRSGRAGRRPAPCDTSRLTSSSATKSPNLRADVLDEDGAVAAGPAGVAALIAPRAPARPCPRAARRAPSSIRDARREHLVGALVGGLQVARRVLALAGD